MAAILEQLQGNDIPTAYRASDRTIIFKVTSQNGEEFLFVDETEAAAKVVELTSSNDHA